MGIVKKIIILLVMGLAMLGCSKTHPTAPEDKMEQTSPPQTGVTKSGTTRFGTHQAGMNNSVENKTSNKEKYILDVPLIKQNPELKYGCEVTSLAMVLQYAGIQADKMTLANQMPKDPDPVRKSPSGDITRWGNPNHGFVGDVTGKNAGYAIYAKPLEKLMNRYFPNRTVNLTKRPFDDILKQIKNGKPVIVWTTGDFKAPNRWETWRHEAEKITTPLDLHAVVVVGFDSQHVYINDPLTGKKQKKININTFRESWKYLGQQALSYN